MTLEIGFVLVLLLASLVLFVTERLGMDVVALLVLATLAVSGVVSTDQALSGFSNPAVVTVWAMFILSAGLTRTGVAEVIGRNVLRWAGRSEAGMVAIIMLTAGGLSAFMNNIGVAALMLPVVVSVSRRTGQAPSRLLMPLAYGSLLGGLTTLIGTPPNLLISNLLRDEGLAPFTMFDFMPVGLAVMLAGIAFMVLPGRRLLPRRDPVQESTARHAAGLPHEYRLSERSAVLRLPAGTPLSGWTLERSRVGSAAGLNVFAIVRGSKTHLAPGPAFVLQPGDRLLVEGRLDRLNELRGWCELAVEQEDPGLDRLVSSELGLAELELSPGSSLIGRSLEQVAFRDKYRAIVLAVRRGVTVLYLNLADTRLEPGDRLLVHARHADLQVLRNASDFIGSRTVIEADLSEPYRLRERLFMVRVPGDSLLVGRTLAESRMGDALGLGVLGLHRAEETVLLPGAQERL